MLQPFIPASLHFFPAHLINWISPKLPGEDASTKDLKCPLQAQASLALSMVLCTAWRLEKFPHPKESSTEPQAWHIFRVKENPILPCFPLYEEVHYCISSLGDCLILANCYTAPKGCGRLSPWCGLTLHITLNVNCSRGSIAVQWLGHPGGSWDTEHHQH